jgi:hypothetical protein
MLNANDGSVRRAGTVATATAADKAGTEEKHAEGKESAKHLAPLYAAAAAVVTSLSFRDSVSEHSGTLAPARVQSPDRSGSWKKVSVFPSTSLTTRRRGAAPSVSSVKGNPPSRSRLS